MRVFTAEAIGTMLLILLGDGVVAGVLLSKSKAEKSGWIVITTGWALAVAIGVYAVGRISGAHINPAVTLGLAAVGKLAWAEVPHYILGQFLGAFLGALVTLRAPFFTEAGTRFATAFLARLAAALTAVCAKAPAATAARSVI